MTIRASPRMVCLKRSNMDKLCFGKRMRLCRERLGLSQADLASKCGLHPSAICLFETGSRLPNFENLIVIADALAESVDVLMGRSDGARPTGKEVDSLLDNFASLCDDEREFVLCTVGILARRAALKKRTIQ